MWTIAYMMVNRALFAAMFVWAGYMLGTDGGMNGRGEWLLWAIVFAILTLQATATLVIQVIALTWKSRYGRWR